MSPPAFLMRAWKIEMPVGWVWWTALETPDFTGETSGYSPAVLEDIVVVSRSEPAGRFDLR